MEKSTQILWMKYLLMNSMKASLHTVSLLKSFHHYLLPFLSFITAKQYLLHLQQCGMTT